MHDTPLEPPHGDLEHAQLLAWVEQDAWLYDGPGSALIDYIRHNEQVRVAFAKLLQERLGERHRNH